ncbi:CHASE2 domain-containing protein [Leptolyngbya sp. PL-A3]|uniref:CHASE2 domain-containing protein n=1 Tax=Leptolyngbya sp. PL-A3 TaxID=2933911 RepID=UPI00329751FB
MKTHLFHKLKNYSADWQIGVFAVALVAVARFLGAFTSVEWAIFDNFLRLRPEEPRDEEIVLVGIDARDIQKVGTYPIPDRILAQLVSRIYEYDPAVVGLGIFRDTPIGEGRNELIQLLKQHQNFIVIEKLLLPPIPAPSEAPPSQVGFDDYLIDSDGMVRRSFLGLSPSGKVSDFKFSFSIRLAEAYLKRKHHLALENSIRDPWRMRFGSVEIPYLQPGNPQKDSPLKLDGLQSFLNFRPSSVRGYSSQELGRLQVFLNYRNSKTFSTITFSDVLVLGGINKPMV